MEPKSGRKRVGYGTALDAMAPKPQGQSGSEQNEKAIGGTWVSREINDSLAGQPQPTQPAEALPDALLTHDDIMGARRELRVGYTGLLDRPIDEALAAALNALLAPRVAARVAAALCHVASLIPDTVIGIEEMRSDEGLLEYFEKLRRMILRLSNAPAQAALDKLLAEHTEPLLKRIAELEKLLNPLHVSQVQTSGPQCKKCGAFTTKKRVNTHGLCMKCENEVALASHTGQKKP